MWDPLVKFEPGGAFTTISMRFTYTLSFESKHKHEHSNDGNQTSRDGTSSIAFVSVAAVETECTPRSAYGIHCTETFGLFAQLFPGSGSDEARPQRLPIILENRFLKSERCCVYSLSEKAVLIE